MDPIFIGAMRKPESGWPTTKSDAYLIMMAHTSCQALDNGQDLLQVVSTLHAQSPDVSYGAHGYLVGASAVAYCPQHMKTVMDQAKSMTDAPAS